MAKFKKVTPLEVDAIQWLGYEQENGNMEEVLAFLGIELNSFVISYPDLLDNILKFEAIIKGFDTPSMTAVLKDQWIVKESNYIAIYSPELFQELFEVAE